MADAYKELRDFSYGVIAANEPDIIPDNSVAKAWNSAFRSIGQKQAILGTRPGLSIVTGTSTAITGTPTLHRLVPYAYNNAGTWVYYLAVFCANGVLHYKLADETLSAALAVPANFPYSTTTCFTSGDYLPDAVVMNNRLLIVNSNGERRSLLGTAYKAFGLEPVATIAVTAQGSGSSSMPAEAYGVAITSYDSATGAESSRSAIASVTLTANQRVRVVITPTAAETAQYTHWRIYLRRDTTQTQPFKVLVTEDAGGANISSTGDIPIATTTAYVDMAAADIANLIIPSPDDLENDPPSTDTRFLAIYGRRLIAVSRDTITWSKIDRPDNFPPTNSEPIETGEGDQATGVFRFSDELLLIFTANNLWGIFGNDPQTWVIRPIDHTVGCSTHTSITEFDGKVGWWDDEFGPVVFDGTRVIKEGLDKLGPAIVTDGVSPTRRHRIAGGVDPNGQRIVWSASTASSNRNNIMLPYHYQMTQWESSKWDPMDIASLGVAVGSDGNRHLYMGNYAGQLFRLNKNVQNDGVPSGTKSGTFVAVSDTIGTINGQTGLYTTGAGLAERYVTIVDADNKPITRVRLSSNTSSVLTFATNVTGLIMGATYSYYVGGPDFRLYTKWLDMDQPFLDKRFDLAYIQAQADGDVSDLLLSTHINLVDEDAAASATTHLGGDLWDTGIWGTATWAGIGSIKERISIFKTAHALRIAILHFEADVDLRVIKLAVLARVLGDRY